MTIFKRSLVPALWLGCAAALATLKRAVTYINFNGSGDAPGLFPKFALIAPRQSLIAPRASLPRQSECVG